MIGDLDFSEQIRWGAEHLAFQRTEQLVLLLSSLFMPLGLLGLAQVTRWSAPRLTLAATPLVLWGMWGFHNVLAMGGRGTRHARGAGDRRAGARHG